MKAHEAFEAIAHAEPTLEFLATTAAGLAAEEMAELVRLLRSTSQIPVDLARVCTAPHLLTMDVCGTGGARGSRLNTSTLSALFLPDYGVRVAKHGGRSASGKKGSLDLLDALGLTPQHAFENAAEHLRSEGLCYLGAGFTYAGFARYAPLRKAAGHPTLFNLLGPLLNPAPLSTRLLGCYDARVRDLLADTVSLLGENALLVCSEDDEGFLDEGAPWSTTTLVHVAGTHRKQTLILPPRCERPGRREELFADGVAAALALLRISADGNSSAKPQAKTLASSQPEPREKDFESTEARSARTMVGFNVALGVLAARLAGGEDFSRSQSTMDAVFAAFDTGFETRRARAVERLARMRSLTPVHADSPTLVSPVLNRAEPKAIGRAAKSDGPRPFPWNPTRGFLFAEFKRATPTRSFADGLTLEERVRAYEGAGAFSVVTHPSFGGDISLLADVRAATQKPLLAKDFLANETQVDALIDAGADGVLVLVDLVGEGRARELAAHVQARGATAFVESSFGIPTFGVPMLNSRNLFSLREDRSYRDALAARLPAGGPFVIASSFESTLDAELLLPLGGSMVVGGALMSLTNEACIRAWIKSATGTRGLLKACGARDADDIRTAYTAGADLVGINLIARSKRRMQPAALASLLAAVDMEELLRHCVFLTDSTSDAAQIASIDSALSKLPPASRPLEQCYGTPLLSTARGLLGTFPAAPLAGVRAVLLDGHNPGSGALEPYPTHTAGSPRYPTFCAGGVTLDTAAARLAEARAKQHAVCGIDVASGVERLDDAGARLGFDLKKIAGLKQILEGITP